MPQSLSVRDDRRARSKSPGGRDRDRDRSHSRDTRPRSPPKQRRPSKYSESETDSEEDREYKGKKSSKKHYDESDHDRRRRTKSSKKYSESESEESDRRRSRRSDKSSRRDQSSSEDDRRKDKSRKDKDKDRSSKKKSRDSDSSDSESPRSKTKSKTKRGQEAVTSPVATVPAPYPPGYAAGFAPAVPGAFQDTRHMSFAVGDPRYAPPSGYMQAPPVATQARYGSFSGAPTRYAEVGQYQYAQPDPNLAYRYNEPAKASEKQYVKTYNSKGEAQLVEVQPEYERKRPDKKSEEKLDRREKKYYEDKYAEKMKEKSDPRDKKYYEDKFDKKDKYGSLPEATSRKMSQLNLNTGLGAGLGASLLAAGRHASSDGGKPPASPLLEAYKGTYQSISPMPSALVLRGHKNDSDLSDFDLESDSSIDSDDPNADLKKKIKKLEKEKSKHQKDREHGKDGIQEIKPRDRHNSIEVREPGRRPRAESDVSTLLISPSGRKTVSFYDATEDATKIAAALEGTHRPPNVKPLIAILPGLTTDDLLALRTEYKNVAKVGGQGINIAKHIKMRVPGNLGKACYATALGRWESEAYWANSWYQGGASRRELLIESLMGRSNSDIREIKNCFKDKRYNDDLEKCMKAELKADKFRTAILLALEEQRMSERPALDIKLVREDVQGLHRALTAPGGETLLIQIIVVRSDSHLREVMRVFEKAYNVNFARAMIEKSRNLVGETLAHILNGALNRPMRDALLVHQAISETAPGKERAELLISRLVRLHWEPRHLEKVKQQYINRYRVPIEVAIHKEVIANMKTEEGRQWAEFCVELVRSSA